MTHRIKCKTGYKICKKLPRAHLCCTRSLCCSPCYRSGQCPVTTATKYCVTIPERQGKGNHLRTSQQFSIPFLYEKFPNSYDCKFIHQGQGEGEAFVAGFPSNMAAHPIWKTEGSLGLWRDFGEHWREWGEPDQTAGFLCPGLLHRAAPKLCLD